MSSASSPTSAPELLDKIADSVTKELSSGIKEFKQELLKVVANKKISDVPNAKLDDACNQVFEKAKETFDKNIEKFKIYSMRNIFVPSTAAAGAQASSAASSSAGPVSATPDEHLQRLRTQYLQLQAEYSELSGSCKDTDLLLKDMRATLFTLRVGAQAFDNGDIQPIAETLAGMTQNREKLLNLCSDAKGIINKLEGYNITGDGQIEHASTESQHDEDGAMDVTQDNDADGPASPAAIETRDADDILLLARSLKNK